MVDPEIDSVTSDSAPTGPAPTNPAPSDSPTGPNYTRSSELIHPLQTTLSPVFNQAAFNQMKLALTYIEDAIAWVNHHGQVEWCNAAFDRLSQLSINTILQFVQTTVQTTAQTIGSDVPSRQPSRERSPEYTHDRHELCLADRRFWIRIIPAEADTESNTEAGIMLMIQQQSVNPDDRQTELALTNSEAKLQQQQEFLRRVIDTNPNLIFVKDALGNYILVNQAIANFYNLTIEEVLTKKLDDFCPNPEKAALFLQQNQWVIRNRQGLFIAEEAVESASHHNIEWLQWQKRPIWLPDRQEFGVLGIGVNISDRKRTESALKTILQGTTSVAGEDFFSDFFSMLVQSLVSALGVYHVGIAELRDTQTLVTLACWSANHFQPETHYSLSTLPPCIASIERGIYICSSQVQAIFPNVELLERLEAESYLGIALHNAAGTPIGIMCAIDTKPIADVARTEALMQIFAARAATELEHQQSAAALDQINRELKTQVHLHTQEIVQFQTHLQKQTQLLQAILDNIGDGLIVADLEGQFLVFNPAAQRILGIGGEAIAPEAWVDHYGIYLSDRFTPCPLDQVPLMRAIRGETADNVEIFIRNSQKPKGVWLDITLRPFHDPTGQLVGGVVAFRDITNLKQTEASLRESETRLRAIFEHAPIAIGLVDVKTHRHIRNNAAHRILFGYDDDEIAEVAIETITYPDDLAADLHQVQQLLAGEIANFQMQKRYIRKNGDLLWGNLTCTLIHDPDSGLPLYIMGMIEDISEAKREVIVRKQTEHKLLIVQEQLFLAQERLHHLLSSSPGIIYAATPSSTLDTPLVLTFISTNVMQILGYELPQCLEVDFWLNGIHPDDRNLFKTAEQEMLQQGYATCEYRFRHRDGSYRWLYDQTKLVQDEWGNPLERIGSWMDISDRKAAETQLYQINEQLALTNAELARATRLKDEFLANMSHELRTPLNSILGLSEVMQEGAFGALTDKQRQFLGIIQSSGKHLLELINDVLDLAKIEAGMLDIHIADTSIYSLCEASLTLIQQQAHQKNISLIYTLTEDLGTLQVDERRMRQVLLNLLSNAVKFTPEGGSVTLEVQGNLSQSSVSFSIIDTGIGIAPEDMSKLFQTFVQLDSSLSRHYEGTGLGLVLVKQIVELHGGRVTVSSELGQGSCFQVTLPWQAPPNQPSWNRITLADSPEPELVALSVPRILLAEDEPDNIATLTDYLQMRGFQIILARNRAEAVQKAIAHSPHLVLIDVQIADHPEPENQEPENQEVQRGGLETIRQIRSHVAQVPIIALTDLALPGEQEKCRLAGATDYLIKPVRLKQLVDLIQHHLGHY